MCMAELKKGEQTSQVLTIFMEPFDEVPMKTFLHKPDSEDRKKKMKTDTHHKTLADEAMTYASHEK